MDLVTSFSFFCLEIKRNKTTTKLSMHERGETDANQQVKIEGTDDTLVNRDRREFNVSNMASIDGS